MKTYSQPHSLFKLSYNREVTTDINDEKKRELIALQARVQELELELQKQIMTPEKQPDLLPKSCSFDFHTDFLF